MRYNMRRKQVHFMKISNQRYEITFCTKGGEMQSFLDKETGIEYLYQGDTPYWSGKNPALFPMIGNTYTKDYEIDGKKYAMKNHGLIRYQDLTCIEQDDHSITFAFTDTQETRKQYPFPFQYQVHYALQDRQVTITYEITNTGAKDMPFMFGLHPAFLCPLTKSETFEDYRLIFSNEEHVEQLKFKNGVSYESVDVKEIPLRYDWIVNEDTVIYKNCRSAYVTLQGKEHGVKVSIAGYPFLAFWTPKEGAPFICIEPWLGHGDFEPSKEDFYHREGTLILSPKKTFTTSYIIEVF